MKMLITAQFHKKLISFFFIFECFSKKNPHDNISLTNIFSTSTKSHSYSNSIKSYRHSSSANYILIHFRSGRVAWWLDQILGRQNRKRGLVLPFWKNLGLKQKFSIISPLFGLKSKLLFARLKISSRHFLFGAL